MNNQFDKLRNWLDSLTPYEYQDIIRGFLSAKEQTRLPMPVDTINRGDFLGHIQALNRLEQLKKYLVEHYPDRFKSEQQESEVVPFINQATILEAILLPYATQYHLLDAPAGYGKTALLFELKRRLDAPNLGAYVSTDVCQKPHQLIQYLFNEFDILFPKNGYTMPEDKLILELGSKLRAKQQDEGYVYLLIDLSKTVSSSSILNELLTRLIPGLHRNLKDRFRMVIAGRYLSGRVKNSNLRPQIHQLGLFSYDVLFNLTQNYLTELGSDKERQDISAHIMHISGGHPGAMAKLLKKYHQYNPLPDEFLRYYQSDINDIMKQSIEEVRNDIPPQLCKIMDTLGPCRKFSYRFLQEFIDLGLLPNDDPYEMADELTLSYLITIDEGFLQDDITSRLLAIRLRHENPELFLEICQSAKEIYAKDLENPATYRPEIIMIEALFQELQLEYYQLSNNSLVELELPKRKALAERFFSIILDKYLHILMQKRDPRYMSIVLQNALDKDEYFQFVLNYFLREKTYTEQPYNRLRDNLKKFQRTLRRNSNIRRITEA